MDTSTHLKETPSQTAGPYVHIGLTPNFVGIGGVYDSDLGAALVNDKTRGERITLEGKVLDGTGTPLRDVLLEIWQANASGRYNHPADRSAGALNEEFRGWGRAGETWRTLDAAKRLVGGNAMMREVSTSSDSYAPNRCDWLRTMKPWSCDHLIHVCR